MNAARSSLHRARTFCHIYAQFDQTGERFPDETDFLLGLGLVCDTAFSLSRCYPESLKKIQAAGGLCAPNVYPADSDPTLLDPNWWKYTEEECIRLLLPIRERYESLGLGELRAINTYTPGNGLVAACRKLGIQYILGFCAPTVIEDGGWEIAHYGSPLSPYFVSDEDYRKPEVGEREDAVLMSSMELRNPMVCLNHWSEGPWCPLNALAADRWLEPSDQPWPFLQIAEDWLRQSELSRRPLFFHLNLQYFFAGRCYDHNRYALEWLSRQRDAGRLEIGSLRQWRDRMQKAEGLIPQTTYWRGEMMGFHVGHRPGCFPDVVVDESITHQAIWQKPHSLPVRLYNYTTPWKYPAFIPDGSAPASECYSGIRVNTRLQTAGENVRELTIELTNDGGGRRVPLILWDVFAGWNAPLICQGTADAKVVPHPGGGGSLLIETDVPTGRSELKVRVAGSGRAEVSEKNWGDLIVAQGFHLEGESYTVLASQSPESFSIRVRHWADAKRLPVLESLIGIEYHQALLEETVTLRFDGSRLACWHRFRGVTPDQIEVLNVDEVIDLLSSRTARLLSEHRSSDLLAEGEFQRFGNIRELARWDRKVACTAGNVELERFNQWFRDERPEAGETVIEVHPGIYLPRGSITKVLAHEFDFIRCASGYSFRELCADYPQAWDWGVAAWVQWRQLKVAVKGLTPGDRYTLHLHAFDPEQRDFAQRVHFFDAGNPDNRLEIVGTAEWVLPQGLPGRWEPGALCSMVIPEECLRWESIGIWIVPLAKTILHDWIAERGAPGMFSHLLVTRNQDRFF